MHTPKKPEDSEANKAIDLELEKQEALKFLGFVLDIACIEEEAAGRDPSIILKPGSRLIKIINQQIKRLKF